MVILILCCLGPIRDKTVINLQCHFYGIITDASLRASWECKEVLWAFCIAISAFV